MPEKLSFLLARLFPREKGNLVYTGPNIYAIEKSKFKETRILFIFFFIVNSIFCHNLILLKREKY